MLLPMPFIGTSHNSANRWMRKKILTKAITSVGCPKMKRDAGVKAVFLLRKKTAFTPASLFIFGQRTDVMALGVLIY